MAHPPASAPAAPSKKRKRTPTTSTIPEPTTTTIPNTTTTAPRTAAPTPAHFARLTVIWALDRRIPTPASRAAWAAARGLDAAKKLGLEIPEGSYEMDVGDPDEEEEEERKGTEEREEKDRKKRVRVKKEVVEEGEMRREEEGEEAKGMGDTARVAMPPQTSPAPSSTLMPHALMEVDGAVDDCRRHPRSLRRDPKASSDPVTVLPPTLVSIHKPSSMLGAIPFCVAASASGSTPAHKGLEASVS
ncbi:hypothetical protein DFP72DRAFT_858192 [Ephemerocybe angulata]|uniref:Uncharacterized protein n=1 Tax=Ephemerocybe angulata TaxID=980116 RepID=A0A8H6HCI7_9AGAR|nr:hypothetical protein DFP72DRAFT_858192 [Tulosesus angulatus]